DYRAIAIALSIAALGQNVPPPRGALVTVENGYFEPPQFEARHPIQAHRQCKRLPLFDRNSPLELRTVPLHWKPAADFSQPALRDSSQAVPSLGAGAGSNASSPFSAITMTIRTLPKAVLRIEYLYLCTCRHQPGPSIDAKKSGG